MWTDKASGATVFGILNLLVATHAVFGYYEIALPRASSYLHAFENRTPTSRPSNMPPSVNSSYVDVLFLGELNLRYLGMAMLFAAGVGLLWRKWWGRSLTIRYAWFTIAFYLLMHFAGARYPRLLHMFPMPLLVVYMYAVVLLFAMSRPAVVAAFRPRGDATRLTPDTRHRPASPDRPKRRLRFSRWHVVTALVVLGVIFAEVGWWISHPVQREVLKLKYGNSCVRTSAFVALGRIGPDAEEAVPALIAHARHGRRWGEALLNIGTVPAVIGVLEYYAGSNVGQEYRKEALAALYEMGPDAKDAVPVLIKILASDIAVNRREDIIPVLGKIGPDAKAAIPALTDFADERPIGAAYEGADWGWLRVSKALHQIGLEHLEGQTEVKSLFFSGHGETPFTDAGMEHFRGLTGLRRLGLTRTEITDAGLVHLKGLRNLQTLHLGRTQITDAGLAHLKGLTTLEELQLYGTRVGGTGLEHLKGLTNLETLGLWHTRITDKGVNYLRQALPDCTIRQTAPSIDELLEEAQRRAARRNDRR